MPIIDICGDLQYQNAILEIAKDKIRLELDLDKLKSQEKEIVKTWFLKLKCFFEKHYEMSHEDVFSKQNPSQKISISFPFQHTDENFECIQKIIYLAYIDSLVSLDSFWKLYKEICEVQEKIDFTDLLEELESSYKSAEEVLDQSIGAKAQSVDQAENRPHIPKTFSPKSSSPLPFFGSKKITDYQLFEQRKQVIPRI